MSRNYETKITITCDRCGAQAVFITEKQAKEMLNWKQLSSNYFFFSLDQDSVVVDLCPEYFILFKTEFIRWFGNAFRKAFDE